MPEVGTFRNLLCTKNSVETRTNKLYRINFSIGWIVIVYKRSEIQELFIDGVITFDVLRHQINDFDR